MSDDRSLTSLFGKAKKWAQQELKNATSVSSDPRDARAAEQANEQLGREINDDAENAAAGAVYDAVLPKSVKDYQAKSAAEKEQRHTETDARARTDRAERAGESTVTLAGAIAGTASGLAVRSEVVDYDGQLAVSVETVDPVPMAGGTVTGFCFSIPQWHGDGTYELVDTPGFDATQYQLYIVEENEGWWFHPTYGPGTIVVRNGVAEVQLTVSGPGDDTIRLTARVALGIN